MSHRILNLLFVGLLLTLELLWAAPIQTVFAAPAPPLTYLQVIYVRSQTKSWEYIPDNQFSTLNDHGGSWLEVETAELGYGTNLIALYNGQRMTNASNTPILNSSRAIIGWRRIWRISTSITNGTFTYRATSINSPWNTMSDRLSIR